MPATSGRLPPSLPAALSSFYAVGYGDIVPWNALETAVTMGVQVRVLNKTCATAKAQCHEKRV